MWGRREQAANAVLRGGSWNNNGRNCRSAYRNNNGRNCRSAYRNNNGRDNRNNNIGLRVTQVIGKAEPDE